MEHCLMMGLEPTFHADVVNPTRPWLTTIMQSWLSYHIII